MCIWRIVRKARRGGWRHFGRWLGEGSGSDFGSFGTLVIDHKITWRVTGGVWARFLGH